MGKNEGGTYQQPDATFVKEVTYRSTNTKEPGEISPPSSNLNTAFRLIKEVNIFCIHNLIMCNNFYFQSLFERYKGNSRPERLKNAKRRIWSNKIHLYSLKIRVILNSKIYTLGPIL